MAPATKSRCGPTRRPGLLHDGSAGTAWGSKRCLGLCDESAGTGKVTVLGVQGFALSGRGGGGGGGGLGV